MAEQKKPSAFDGVTGKTTSGARGPAQSPVSPVTEALYQPREYDKPAEKDSTEEEELGLRAQQGDAMYAFDMDRVYSVGEQAENAYVKAGIPVEVLPYNNYLLLGLADEAKQKLNKGQVAPKHEARMRSLAEYVPSVPAKYAETAKKAGLPYVVLTNINDRDPTPVQQVRIAARYSTIDPDPAGRFQRESNLPATQRSLQRIAEATPPTKKK